MNNGSTLTLIPVSVTVVDKDGGHSVVYDPNPVPVAGVPVRLQYKLAGTGWVFAAISYEAPFSNLELVSQTEFTIIDNGGDQGTFSFSITLAQSGSASGAGQLQTSIDSDPEVVNGPRP